MQPRRKFKFRNTVREIHFCQKQAIFLIIGYGVVQIYDIEYENPIQSIHFGNSIRSAGLSSCGRYFYVVNFQFVLFIYETKTATILQKIQGINNSVKEIKFCKNFSQVLFGNSQMICLWSIRSNVPLMRTEHWRNINCYDIHPNGNKFALGTYSGSIYVLDYLEQGKCNQIELKKQKNCIMVLCFHKNQLISAAHGGGVVIATIEQAEEGKIVKYTEVTLQTTPRSIKSIGDTFYMFDRNGMSWFNKYQKLLGFTDNKQYHVIVNEDEEVLFIKQGLGELEWWPGRVFKSKQQAQLQNQKENLYKYGIIRKQVKR